MTYSVYQHWDPLRVCIVGRSYPPEFYSWITVPHVRKLFERIAIETEEDYQAIIKKLQEFNVEILRPDLDIITVRHGKFTKPPMNPRDTTIMIGEKFYINDETSDDLHYNNFFKNFYTGVKNPDWPQCNSFKEFNNLPMHIQNECRENFELKDLSYAPSSCYDNILKNISSQGNNIVKNINLTINGAMISRIGKDLYVGTPDNEMYGTSDTVLKLANTEFTQTRNHIVNTHGHSDGTYCPVCPGLIISLRDIPTYADTFPGWEVIYLPNQSWNKVRPFLNLKEKNQGKWWIPGFEHDRAVIDVVENWLNHWTGYVEETVFDVNMLIIDPKNVIVFGYNKQVFDALDRYGITPHIVPFRHRYFWDGGIHCVTSDLHREGTMQDYFPERNQ